MAGPAAAPGRSSRSGVGSKWEGETIAIVNENTSVIRDNITSLERPRRASQQRETQECRNQPVLADAINEFDLKRRKREVHYSSLQMALNEFWLLPYLRVGPGRLGSKRGANEARVSIRLANNLNLCGLF